MLLFLQRLTTMPKFIHDCKPAKIHAPWLDTSDGKAFSANLWRDCCREFERLHPGLLAAAGVEQ